ncbi:MAG: PilZ domain-containing protein [Terriglobales bacterium]
MYVRTRSVALGAPMYRSRRELRYVSSIAVGVTRFLRFGPTVTRGMSLDVSRSGMSVLVCGAPLVGETVVIAPRSKTEPFEILATVRHSTDARSGFQFYPLSGEAEKAIEDWIEELKREEVLLRPRVWRFPGELRQTGAPD